MGYACSYLQILTLNVNVTFQRQKVSPLISTTMHALQAGLTGMMEDGNGKRAHIVMVAVLAADIINILHPPCLLGPLLMQGLFLHG